MPRPLRLSTAHGRGLLATRWRFAGCAASWSLGCLVGAACSPPPSARDRERVRTLVIEQPMRATLAPGEAHGYRLQIDSGTAVRVLIDQHETDLVVAVTGPGQESRRIDATDYGVESVTLVASAAGEARLTVSGADPAAAGSYDIRLDGRLRPVAASDEARTRAETLATTAKPLAGRGNDSRSDALAALNSVLTLWRGLGDRRGAAITLSRIGDLHHAAGELNAAESAYLEALTPARDVSDGRLVAELLNNIGVLDWRRGRLKQASGRFDEALAAWQSLPSVTGAASTMTNHGNLFFESGAYQEALDRFEAAQRIFEAQHDPRGLAYALNNIGVTMQALGDRDAALSFLQRATAAFNAAGDVAGEGRAHLRLGRELLARGERDRAKAEIAAGLTLIRRAGDRLGEGDASDLAGLVAAAAGEAREALGLHEQARALYRGIGNQKGEATALHHEGAALLSLGDPAKAVDRLKLALEIRNRVGLRDAEVETLSELARAERQRGRLDLARAHLRAALDATENVRGRVAGQYARLAFLSLRQSYYSEQIDVLMELHERHPDRGYAREAFETSERARGRSLLDEIEASTLDVNRAIDPGLLAEERELRQQMDFWAYRLDSVASRPEANTRIADARRELAGHVAAYRRLQARIRAASGAEGAVQDPPAIGLVQIQRQILDQDTALLRIALGDRRSYAWLLTSDAMRTAILPGRAAIDQPARRVRELLSIPRPDGPGGSAAAALESAVETLSAMLLAPLAGELKATRLLVVADGVLQTVPFAVLHEPGTDDPLVVRHEVVMLPSASILAALRRRADSRARAPKVVAVFADAVYDPADRRIRRSPPGPGPSHAAEAAQPRRAGKHDSFSPLSLRRLPFSGMEAEWIADLLPSAPDRLIATGFAVTRDAVASPALKDYRIVHFAAHAVVNDDHPEVSGIALSLFDEHGAARDGFLRLHEIRDGLNLRADLVVVSACETAVGRDVPGEGLMGLARGFFEGGASRVLASLYTVQDAGTAELMREFYRAMLGSDRLAPAAALRAAQLRMRSEPQWRDPYYWSAFVLLGDPQ